MKFCTTHKLFSYISFDSKYIQHSKIKELNLNLTILYYKSIRKIKYKLKVYLTGIRNIINLEFIV